MKEWEEEDDMKPEQGGEQEGEEVEEEEDSVEWDVYMISSPDRNMAIILMTGIHGPARLHHFR